MKTLDYTLNSDEVKKTIENLIDLMDENGLILINEFLDKVAANPDGFSDDIMLEEAKRIRMLHPKGKDKGEDNYVDLICEAVEFVEYMDLSDYAYMEWGELSKLIWENVKKTFFKNGVWEKYNKLPKDQQNIVYSSVNKFVFDKNNMFYKMIKPKEVGMPETDKKHVREFSQHINPGLPKNECEEVNLSNTQIKTEDVQKKEKKKTMTAKIKELLMTDMRQCEIARYLDIPPQFVSQVNRKLKNSEGGMA